MPRIPGIAWGLAVALLLVLPLLAGQAGAHGASITKTQDVGPYRVLFYTSDFVTEGEFQRLAWNVTDLETFERVAVDDPTVQVRFIDTSDQVVKDERMTPEQPVEGIIVLDITIGPPGRANYTLFLPGNHSVQFEDRVQGIFDPGRLTGGVGGGEEDGERDSPLPAPLALAALGLAAAALHRSRRRP